MKNVRCPRCKTEHRLPNDATGYTCSGCGTEWVFAKCAQCHSTFHAPARTASWTCKRCGFRNVSAAQPEPELEGPGPNPKGGGPSFLDGARARWNGLSQRGKLVAVAAPLLVIIVIVIVVVAGGGGGTPAADTLAAAKQSYCLHSHALAQELDRKDAVAREAHSIHLAARTFHKNGDPATAKQLQDVVKAAKKLERAIKANKGQDTAGQALLKAISDGPSC